MSITQGDSKGTRTLARSAAALLFVLAIAMGYALPPQVQGAIATPIAAEDQDITEPDYLPSECGIDGLVFSDCNMDF